MVMKHMISLKSELLESLRFEDEVQDVVFWCKDGARVTANSVFLYLVSPTLRPLMANTMETDYHVSCPDLRSSDLETIFADIYHRREVIRVNINVVKTLFESHSEEDEDQVSNPSPKSLKQGAEVIVKEGNKELFPNYDMEHNVKWEDDYLDHSYNNGEEDDEEEDIKGNIEKVVDNGSYSSISGDRGQSIYSCNQCTRTFKQRKNMEKHVEIHRRNTDRRYKYPCEICGRKFTKANNRKRHMTRCGSKDRSCEEFTELLPDNGESFKCNVCDKVFDCIRSITAHVLIHRPREDRYKFPCNHCKKKFTKAYIATRHMNKCQFKRRPKTSSMISMERRKRRIEQLEMEVSFMASPLPHFDRLYCEVCDKTFADPHLMFSHVDKEHGPFPEVSCDHCNLSFDRQSELNLHIKRDHMQEVKVPCPDCGKLQHTSYMKTHYELVHKVCEPISCEVCGKTYNNEFKFKVHIRSHERPSVYKTGKQNYLERYEKECLCNLNLKTVTSKVDHYKVVHLGYEKCLKCQKLVKNVEETGHICTPSLENKEETQRTYRCPQCGSVFQRASALNYHEKTAHSTARSECDQCGKSFRSVTHMRKHQVETCNLVGTPCAVCGKVVKQMAKHLKSAHMADEEKRRRCEDCGKGFCDESKLKCHRMNVHLKLRPYKCRFGCDMAYNDKSNRTSHERKKHPELYNIMVQKKNLASQGLETDSLIV